MGPKVRPKGIRRPDLDTVYSINPDGSRNFIIPSDVRGRWQWIKAAANLVLIAIYVVLPWIEIAGRPALLLSIGERSAFVFGQTFTNQDFYLVFFLVTGVGFGLIVLTSLLGRVWCGFACPQTVFLEGVFRRIERLIEGSREKRLLREKKGKFLERQLRRLLKHGIFLALSSVIAHIFLSYFIPVRELSQVVQQPPSENWVAFCWVVAMTLVMYFDFVWFREQLCLTICPYGRLQSALVDADTIIVGYDEGRGEPRGKKAEGNGDCVDCFRCVAVCPTGIDIRNGLQMECIGCANCIDACDEIMDRVGKPRGLVRYDSKNGLEGKGRRLLRPRVWLYAVLGIIGLTVFWTTALARTPFEANILRAKGLPYTLEETSIRNVFTIHLRNKASEPRNYRVEASVVVDGGGAEAPIAFMIPQAELRLEGLAETKVPILANIPRDRYSGKVPLQIRITEVESGFVYDLDLTFRGP